MAEVGWERRRTLDDRQLRHLFRRLVVVAQQGRIQHQRGGDFVESVEGWVGREQLRRIVARQEVHAEQIADRVRKFDAIEPAQGHVSARTGSAFLGGANFTGNPSHQPLLSFRVRARLVFRRHFAEVEVVHHLDPDLRAIGGIEVGG